MRLFTRPKTPVELIEDGVSGKGWKLKKLDGGKIADAVIWGINVVTDVFQTIAENNANSQLKRRRWFRWRR